MFKKKGSMEKGKKAELGLEPYATTRQWENVLRLVWHTKVTDSQYNDRRQVQYGRL